MFKREHGIIRRMVQAKKYVLTYHAFEEMIADDLHVQDIEHIVIHGSITRIETDQDTKERKYIIFGKSYDKRDVEVVAKINNQVVIITVYVL